MLSYLTHAHDTVAYTNLLFTSDFFYIFYIYFVKWELPDGMGVSQESHKEDTPP